MPQWADLNRRCRYFADGISLLIFSSGSRLEATAGGPDGGRTTEVLQSGYHVAFQGEQSPWHRANQFRRFARMAFRFGLQTRQNRKFGKTKSAKRISMIRAVHVRARKFLFTKIGNCEYLRVSCTRWGAYASSRTLSAGCDGRGRQRQTCDANADGEGVWSWHPWAGAKCARRWLVRDGD